METQKTEQRIVTVKANSFCGRYNGTGTDFKLYWDTLEELLAGIDAVIEAKNYLNTLNVEVK